MSTVTPAAGVMQMVQQTGEGFEILEAFKIGFFDFFSFGTH
jgi:hypothetical protein